MMEVATTDGAAHKWNHTKYQEREKSDDNHLRHGSNHTPRPQKVNLMRSATTSSTRMMVQNSFLFPKSKVPGKMGFKGARMQGSKSTDFDILRTFTQYPSPTFSYVTTVSAHDLLWPHQLFV